jgi:hypothetical protein
MSLNTGTLISAAIRPVDSLDPIASAYATEIKGGLHSYATLSERNSIIFERREWGMIVNVYNDITSSNNKTYQLKYNNSSTNIMDNLNWVEFSGSGGSGGGSEWIDSVKSIINIEPSSPTNGDRYILGNSPTGTNWSLLLPGLVVQWNLSLSKWDSTSPTEGMSVRVDNEDNSIYKYEGGSWQKEKVGQVRYIQPTTSNSGLSYSVTTNPPINEYVNDMVFLTNFSTSNIGPTVSLDINSLGYKLLKKPTSSGLSNLNPGEIKTGVIYNISYDGTYFQINRPYTNDDVFNVKYYVEPTDYIVVPQNYQYLVYGDLTIEGTIVNNGKIIIMNGSLIISGSGSYVIMPGSEVVLASLSSATTSYTNSETIEFTTQNTIYGPSVSAVVKDGSLTASKLDTGSNGGATAGYLLSVDSSGDFQWVDNVIGPGGGGVQTPDDKSFILTSDAIGDGQPSGVTISHTPLIDCYVGVFINGQEFEVGYGSTSSSSCYFSNDGGVTAKTINSPNNIEIGDELYWNESVAGVGLYNTWRVSLHYLL